MKFWLKKYCNAVKGNGWKWCSQIFIIDETTLLVTKLNNIAINNGESGGSGSVTLDKCTFNNEKLIGSI